MRAYADDEQPELLDQPSLLYFGVQAATPLVFDSTEIVLRRSGCEGWCPVYEVRIRSDGQVRFRGDQMVCSFGEHKATADPYAVRHLIRAIEAAGVEQTSQSTFLLTSPNYDDALVSMGERVDQIAGTARWLPIRTPSGPMCPRTSGTVRFR